LGVESSEQKGTGSQGGSAHQGDGSAVVEVPGVAVPDIQSEGKQSEVVANQKEDAK
jgi:hypothetical protein